MNNFVWWFHYPIVASKARCLAHRQRKKKILWKKIIKKIEKCLFFYIKKNSRNAKFQSMWNALVSRSQFWGPKGPWEHEWIVHVVRELPLLFLTRNKILVKIIYCPFCVFFFGERVHVRCKSCNAIDWHHMSNYRDITCTSKKNT